MLVGTKVKFYNRAFFILLLSTVLALNGFFCCLSPLFLLPFLCSFYHLFSFFPPKLHLKLHSPYSSVMSWNCSCSLFTPAMNCPLPMASLSNFGAVLAVLKWWSYMEFVHTLSFQFLYIPETFPGLLFLSISSSCPMFPNHACPGWPFLPHIFSFFPLSLSTSPIHNCKLLFLYQSEILW